MALEQAVVLGRDDDVRDLRGEEATQPAELLELGNLVADAPLETLVEVTEFGRLLLDRVVVLLDP